MCVWVRGGELHQGLKLTLLTNSECKQQMQHHLIIWLHDGGLRDNGHYHKPEPSLGLISDNGQRGKTILQKKRSLSPLKTY